MAQREALSLGKKTKERTSGGEGRSLRVLRTYRVSRPGCSGLLGPGSRQEEGRSSTSPVWSGREAFHTGAEGGGKIPECMPPVELVGREVTA